MAQRTRHVWTVALAWALTAGLVLAQQAPSRDAARPPSGGRASIEGTVVGDDEARTPIPHAVLVLSSSSLRGQRMTATDEAGRYAFPDLPSAVYTLAASRGAYVTAAYGALSPGAPPLPIQLDDGQRFVAHPIILVKGSVIAGRITDAFGHPIAATRVTATSARTLNGERHYGAGMTAVTDSRGLYRIYGLAAGDYVVSSTAALAMQPVVVMSADQSSWADARAGARGTSDPPPPTPHPMVAAPTYFPGVVDMATAAVVSLGRAEERQGVDIQVIRVGTARVTGVVYGVDGRPAAGASIVRASAHGGSSQVPSPIAVQYSRASADGSFTLSGVTPGDYVITARASETSTAAPGGRGLPMPSGPLTLWGQADVSVNGDDLEGVDIRLQPGMTVSGSVVFEGATPRPADLVRFAPRLVPADADSSPANGGESAAATAADWTFRIDGVMPGPYVLTGTGDLPSTTGAAPAWTVKSVVVEGRDLLDTPFEIRPRQDVRGVVVTYTDRSTLLNGRLVDAGGQAASQFRVVVFTTNRARWSARGLRRWSASIRAGTDGSFRVSGLPPGQYYLCAVVDDGQAQTNDAKFLESVVPTSTTMTLVAGETQTQTFRVGG